MAMIPTVRGSVDSKKLGVTLMHEHLCWRAPEKYMKEAMEYQVMLCRKAMEAGINTIVDLSPTPNVAKIIELNKKIPELNLILSVGAYIQSSMPPEIVNLTEDGMVEHMTHCLTKGYRGFEKKGVRAGIIKIASGKGKLGEWEAKNFRAAARVQKRLRVPIALHSVSGCREQMKYLRKHGAKVSSTFYSHIEAEFGWEGRTLEEEERYLVQVLKTGSYLLFNNFDFDNDTPWADLVALMDWFEKRGHGDKVLISVDANWRYDEDGRPWHQYEKSIPKCGKRTYAYMITHGVPMLMASGVSLQRINRYLIENPRRFFENGYR